MRLLRAQPQPGAKDRPSTATSELASAVLVAEGAASGPKTLARELLGSASTLLARSGYLHAIHVLHVEIARALGEDPPLEYTSRRKAEAQQRRWEAQLAPLRPEPGLVAWIRELRRRLPSWAPAAGAAFVLAALTARYAYAIHSRNFSKQHPEGNWVSRYYNASDFAGYPLVRYDTGINYDWGKGGPAQDMGTDLWSAQWDTCLFVKADLDIELRLSADDSGRLFVDGTLALESNRNPSAAKITLLHGVRHLRLDYQEKGGRARAKLEGLEMGDTDAYRFVRPVFSGADLSCK
jgi:hypothetical protein